MVSGASIYGNEMAKKQSPEGEYDAVCGRALFWIESTVFQRGL
jgi:hypothetical protein